MRDIPHQFRVKAEKAGRIDTKGFRILSFLYASGFDTNFYPKVEMRLLSDQALRIWFSK